MQSYATYAKIVFSSKYLLKIIHIEKNLLLIKQLTFQVIEVSVNSINKVLANVFKLLFEIAMPQDSHLKTSADNSTHRQCIVTTTTIGWFAKLLPFNAPIMFKCLNTRNISLIFAFTMFKVSLCELEKGLKSWIETSLQRGAAILKLTSHSDSQNGWRVPQWNHWV